MPKFMIEGTYTTEGLRSLMKDKASGRKALAEKAVKAIGGTVHEIYFSFGDNRVFVIAEAPDMAIVNALNIAVSAAGAIQTRVVPLLTVEEMDQGLSHNITYGTSGR